MRKSGSGRILKDFHVTDYQVFQSRRQIVKSLSWGLLATIGVPLAAKADCARTIIQPPKDQLTTFDNATRYNNYYEFSTDKSVVRHHAKNLTLTPWSVSISGEVEKPITLSLDDILRQCVEERIYRFRCVEGWSMVVPWQGVQLSALLKKAQPLSKARYVQFTSVYRPEEMIGQRRPTLAWPYQEALRVDEAMHPLTLLATGMYGQSLPPQNGAPLRLITPWKYGFKSIKAVTHIEFLTHQPKTTWQLAAPKEYGFYANVNPQVPHPRWSQRREAPLGQSKKKPTLMFNGYEDQVASLYSGMDLKANY